MFLHKFVLACVLLVCPVAATAQTAEEPTVVSLIVDEGYPLQVVLTEKLNFKKNGLVHGTLVEPVFAFDREVIPAGIKVEGTITDFTKPGKWKRISAMLGGNFTPQRDPEITFHTLVLSDGTRIPIQTSVIPGIERSVESDDKRARTLEYSLVPSSKKSTGDRLKGMLWGLSPIQPQYLAAGTRLSADLMAPLNFGVAVLEPGDLDELGGEPRVDSVVSARLVTALDSRTSRAGTPVKALLTRPLFSSTHKLMFPVGAVLRGQVTQVEAARGRHRHGQLAFNFTTIEPPSLLSPDLPEAQLVDGSVLSVQVPHDMKDLRIKEDGTAHIVESKKRFIAPAWAAIKAETSIGNTADSFGTALLGAFRGKALKQVTGSTGSGFGLPASIGGAMVPPVGIGLAFYGVARSIYSNFLGRGRDISLPANMPMEIRLGHNSTLPQLELRPQRQEETAP